MPTSVQTSFLPDDAPEAAALARAAAQRGTPGSFDELHGGSREEAAAGAELAPPWQQFFDAAGADGWVDLAQTKARIERRVQDDGVTYNVYAEGAAAANAWPLEPLPFLIDAAAWATIEAGVMQRARLLDAVLADVYGSRSLLDEGLLPAVAGAGASAVPARDARLPAGRRRAPARGRVRPRARARRRSGASSASARRRRPAWATCCRTG